MRKFIIGLLIGIICGIFIWDYLKLDLDFKINPIITDARNLEKLIDYHYLGFDFTIFKLQDYDGKSIFNFGILKDKKENENDNTCK